MRSLHGRQLIRRAFLVPLILSVLCVAGCHRADQSRPLVAIIIPSADNPFFKAEADAAAARARALGYRVRVDSHNDDAYQQDNLIDAAIASNAAAIVLDNAGSEASIAAVRRATRAGVPCFLIDRPIDADGIARAQIIANNLQGAHIVAGEFARLLERNGKYAELLGIESDNNAQIRTRGFHDVLDQISGLKLVAAQSADWSQSEAFEKTETILQANPDLNGIIAGNDTMALGAAAAVKGAHRTGIIIVGFDGSPDAIDAIKRGEMQATALQPAVMIADLAVDQLDRFRKTGSTGKPERQIIPCDLITKDNADRFGDFQRLSK